jgi:hypothetical protein
MHQALSCTHTPQPHVCENDLRQESERIELRDGMLVDVDQSAPHYRERERGIHYGHQRQGRYSEQHGSQSILIK